MGPSDSVDVLEKRKAQILLPNQRQVDQYNGTQHKRTGTYCDAHAQKEFATANTEQCSLFNVCLESMKEPDQ